MKHLKTYEGDYYDENFEKYTKFISDKFEVTEYPFGKVEYNYITDDGLKMYISLGGDIDPIFLATIIDFFKECDGKITTPISGQYLYYNLKLSFDFLKKLDVEMNANKYNI